MEDLLNQKAGGVVRMSLGKAGYDNRYGSDPLGRLQQAAMAQGSLLGQQQGLGGLASMGMNATEQRYRDECLRAEYDRAEYMRARANRDYEDRINDHELERAKKILMSNPAKKKTKKKITFENLRESLQSETDSWLKEFKQ